MPQQNNTSRGYFRSLHNNTLMLLKKIREEERQLRLKDVRTDAQNERLDDLFAARIRVYDSIVSLSDTEDDYRRSSVGTAEALAGLKTARDAARQATAALKTATDAIAAIATLVQIISDLGSVIQKV